MLILPSVGDTTEPEKLNSSKSKRKRLRRKQNNMKLNRFLFVGNNADGLMNKLESLENILKENPSAIQSYRPGRIKKTKFPKIHMA